MRLIVALCGLMLLGIPIGGTTVPNEHGSITAPTAAESPVFKFQDKFWINLHHFLRSEAPRRSSGLNLELPLTTFSPADRSAWESTLSVYSDFAKRPYIFDQTFVQIDNALCMQSAPALTDTSVIEPRAVAALNAAAPIYRKRRWNLDHLENQQWIASHSPAIQKYAPSIRIRIARVFDIQPAKEPILVNDRPSSRVHHCGTPGIFRSYLLFRHTPIQIRMSHSTQFCTRFLIRWTIGSYRSLTPKPRDSASRSLPIFDTR